MEAQAALVGAKSRVELDAEAAVDLDFAIVIDPRDTEDKLALRFAQALNQTVVSVVWVLIEDDLEGIKDFS